MITFDDIAEAKGATPIPEDGKPTVGDVVDGLKVLRVKPILASSLISLVISDADVHENLMFKDHPVRAFVVWMIETEKV